MGSGHVWSGACLGFIRAYVLAGLLVGGLAGGEGVGAGTAAAAEPAGVRVAVEPGGRSLFDEGLSQYRKRDATGWIASLGQRLNRGEVQLAHDPKLGYLPALLRELEIPVSSQVLVFSKTAARRHEVSPKTPRALYFNERAAVAYFPGTPDLELAVTDPALGVGFYRLDQTPEARPRLRRDDRCLECHLSTRTLGVPGWVVRSFLTGEDGDIDPLGGRPMVTHRTRWEERWGGYYVTGTHGEMVHLGNLFGTEAVSRHAEEPTANGNVTDLRPFLDVGQFPEPGSDVVSLMVLDHQAYAVTLLMRLRFEAEAALREGKGMRAVDATAEATLRYLLFTDEVPLKAPVRGTSAFARDFEARGPWDAQGRSLRQLDLQTRLLKHPCSFMLHSEAFDQLPEPARRHLYRRLWEVLSGEDPAPEFRRIPPAQRQAIREILLATKKDLPVYWRL